jgi:hypothetical protein
MPDAAVTSGIAKAIIAALGAGLTAMMIADPSEILGKRVIAR